MIDLKNKKILFFAPSGENGRYSSEIKLELLSRGAEVVLYPERPSLSTLKKVLVRLFNNAAPFFFNRYIKNILVDHKEIHFDYLLVVRGEAFSNSTVKLIKKYHSSIKTIIYFWDIFLTNNKSNIIKSFDKAFTFDFKDFRNNKGLIFRPLVYLDKHTKIVKSESRNIDFFFAGTMHSKRYTILQDFKKRINGRAFFFYYFLPSKLIFLKDKIFSSKYKRANLNSFDYKMLSEAELYEKMSQSRSIVDVIYPGQEGLSMRVLEALGSNTKLITDFEGIKNYNFYNPNNILVIDSKNIKIDFSFLESDFLNIESTIKEKYTVRALVDDFFFNESKPEDFFNTN